MRDLVLESDNQSTRPRRWRHGQCHSCHEYSITTRPVSTTRANTRARPLCGAPGCRLSHPVLETNGWIKANGDDLCINATPTQYLEAITMAAQRTPLGQTGHLLSPLLPEELQWLFAVAKRKRTSVRASIPKTGRTTVTGGREAQPEF